MGLGANHVVQSEVNTAGFIPEVWSDEIIAGYKKNLVAANLIKTMKKASRLSILAKANNGRQTKDLYSMMGFTKAYNTAKKSCT